MSPPIRPHALSLMAFEQRTRDYVSRRTVEDESKPEIGCFLKRYVAREIYKVPIAPVKSPVVGLDNP